jgi:hypothetical protein
MGMTMPHRQDVKISSATLAPAKRERDPRLDFFRGLAMFFIYAAHSDGNILYYWIPARFGPSDSADLFVFVSGMTVAIAFGGTFVRQGWLIGSARIAYRCAQLYAAQIGMFLSLAVVVIVGTRLWGFDYVQEIGFQQFFADPANALVGLVTLTYVPPYVDILPLYIVALAMVPVAMAVARLDFRLVLAASIGLYLAANIWRLNFPNIAEEHWWHFNPLAWQLIFFTGFSLRRGWVRVPLGLPWLFHTAVAIIALGVAISVPAIYQHVTVFGTLHQWAAAYNDKTFLDPIRYVHFLAVAYVTVTVLRGHEQQLLRPVLRPIVKCGQQALSIFLSGMVLSQIGGMVFDHIGHGFGPQVLVNSVNISALIAIAYAVAWLKNAPWKPSAAKPAAAVVDRSIAGAASRALPADPWIIARSQPSP